MSPLFIVILDIHTEALLFELKIIFTAVSEWTSPLSPFGATKTMPLSRKGPLLFATQDALLDFMHTPYTRKMGMQLPQNSAAANGCAALPSWIIYRFIKRLVQPCRIRHGWLFITVHRKSTHGCFASVGAVVYR